MHPITNITARDVRPRGLGPEPLVALYTIKPEEFDALFDRLDTPRPWSGASGQVYVISKIKTSRGNMTLALFRGVEQANTEAQTLVQRAIDDLAPDWVMVVGIAGGAPHEDFTIGDVILASEILDFQYQVTHDNKPSELHPRTRALHRSSHAIVAIFPAIRRQISQWASEQEIAAQRPHPPTRDQIKPDVPADYLPLIERALDYHLTHPRNLPVAIPGTIGSGNELLKSVAFLYQLIRGNRQLLSIEMESAGAIAACNTGISVPMLTIRGISDIVGVERSATWTEYACKSAASLAIHLVRSGYLVPPDEGSLQQVDTIAASGPTPALETTTSPAGTLTSTCLAVRNIQRFGDTDIFPKPFEIGLFRDLEVDACALIDRVDAEFTDFFPRNPPSHVSTLSQIGYTGFRWASQLDPLYNAYLLDLVLRIAPTIESTRVPIASGRVFSYRLNIDERGKLFDEDGTWDSFQRTSREHAERSAWVVKTDIADFYSRIPHEKLHSALEAIQRGHHANARVMAILLEYSKNSGVGLPVGGPAARILSEAYLSASDRVLLAKGINYCRYADDYLMFTDSERAATAALRELATLLSEYESLSLQKLKTRVMRKSEYLRTYTHEADDELDKKAISFLRLRLRFDPYSPTAEEDYETLIEHLSGYDVLGMLAREMRKSRVHQQLTRKLLYAAKYINDADVDSATITVAENLRSLLTVFTSVASLLASLLPKVQANTRAFLERKLARLLEDDDSLVLLELHRMIVIRLIAGLDNVDGDTENVIWRQFAAQDSVLVQKECIWALLRLRRANLIRPLLDRFDRSSQWERRAMLAASFVLEGEGEAFRTRVGSRLSPFEELVVKWCEKRGGRLFAEES